MPRKKIDPERLYDCWGSYSVAEANAILLAHRPAHTPQVGKKVTLTGGESCSTIGINNTSGRPDTQCLIDQEITDQMGIPYFSFDFQGGDTIAINLNGDPGIYLHECQQENCRKQFTSRQGNPQRCKYCGSRISREQNRANDESNRINNLR